jgi:DNA-binding LytR/AlgR family response regulator
LKPFSFQRFVKAVSKVPVNSQFTAMAGTIENSPPARKEIFIKSGYEHIKIKIEDIIYIKSDADYTEIYTSEKKYLSSESLRFWLENLDQNQFLRIHKSFIINTSKIAKIVGNQVYLNKEIVVPVGRSYKDSFLGKFLK